MCAGDKSAVTNKTMTPKKDSSATTTRDRASVPLVRWICGMIIASIFSLIYYLAPMYMLTSLLALAFRYPTTHLSWVYASPLILSAIIKPIPMSWILRYMSPMLDYFEYEQIIESKPVNVREQILKGTNYLCVFQPHGALSFGGICSAVQAAVNADAGIEPHFIGNGAFPTAVASALLATPILKHVLGIFGLISASKKSMIRALQKKGVQGCVVLYVGGMAELFLSCENEEKLYLKQRKGFIKLALQQGVDVVPVYLFGNTTVLSVLKTGVLATLSRRLQVSLTYIWGRWYLPIPRPCKLLYVSGQPLGMPQIEKPTQQDIDLWHEKYCAQVQRLFDTYKERVPEYKHKKLEIV